MDGVLVDNGDFHYKSFEAFAKEHQLPFNAEIYHRDITGRTNESIMKNLFGDKINDAQIAQYAYDKEALYREMYKPFMKMPVGLAELLEAFEKKNISCAVASNGPFENIDFVLDELNIRKYFKYVVNATMVKHGKPAPDVYLKAAELLGTPTENCLVFEDSPTGIEAAIAAGIKVIGITSTHQASELIGTAYIVKDFSDPAIKKLFID